MQLVVGVLLPELEVEALHHAADGELGGREGDHVGVAHVAGQRRQRDDGAAVDLHHAREERLQDPHLA